jgi:hypothetical protein
VEMGAVTALVATGVYRDGYMYIGYVYIYQ